MRMTEYFNFYAWPFEAEDLIPTAETLIPTVENMFPYFNFDV